MLCKILKIDYINQKTAEDVFDISVNKYHNFVLANGSVVHNCDTYQSAQIQLQLLADGFNVETISVDRLDTQSKICLPYAYFKSTLYDKRLNVYKKCDLLTEEVLGLERESDGHINHPDQGTAGCFTGDTKVSLVDGRELTFLDLIDEFNSGKANYVYSFNESTKRIEPKLIEKAWCTKRDAQLIEIELDNGEKLRCTPNHKFMLRDGSYCEAQYLQINDSLMPLYRKYPTDVVSMKNYRMYYEPIEDKWHYEHRQFAVDIIDEHYLVHHKDCNPNNNAPDNLVWCSKEKHQQIHAKISTGAHSKEANQKRSVSIKKWHILNKGTDIYKKCSAKLHDANLKLHNRTELDYLEYQLKKLLQHLHGLEIIKLAELNKEARKLYINNIETMFNIKWEDLSNNERDGYAVKYARSCDPTIQERITASLIEAHAAGKYINAYNALNKCNQESKKLKDLCPTIDEEKFYTIFGIEYKSIPSSKRAPWVTKYRRIICKDILNHKVVNIKILDYTEDVYDITVLDNHNFALTAGIFVHNSKDAIDAVVGSLWNASQHAEEFAYDYGESLDFTVDANTVDMSDPNNYGFHKHLIEVDMEEILKNIYEPLSSREARQDTNFLDFGLGAALQLNSDIYFIDNGIIV